MSEKKGAPLDKQVFPITKTEMLGAEAAHNGRMHARAEAQRIVREAEGKFQEIVMSIVADLNERRGTTFDTNPEMLFGESGAFAPGIGMVDFKERTITLALPKKVPEGNGKPPEPVKRIPDEAVAEVAKEA